MKTTIKIIVIFTLIRFSGLGQNPLSPRFQILESGKFDNAFGLKISQLMADFSGIFKSKSVIDASCNCRAFGYKHQMQTLYFGSDIFKKYELFIDAEKTEDKKAHVMYQMIVGLGYHGISSMDSKKFIGLTSSRV